jgi:hypothetical protein
MAVLLYFRRYKHSEKPKTPKVHSLSLGHCNVSGHQLFVTLNKADDFG